MKLAVLHDAKHTKSIHVQKMTLVVIFNTRKKYIVTRNEPRHILYAETNVGNVCRMVLAKTIHHCMLLFCGIE
jgi:hypothetical protein